MRQKVFEYYGLKDQPFGVTPNPRYFFATSVHREALASLLCGIEYQAGFAALISEPGMGKTSLLFDLMARYSLSAHTAFIFNTQCRSDELLRSIADELNIQTTGSDIVQLHSDFRTFLVSQSRPNPVLLILDEAQNLDDSVLESVRLLSDFETADRKLLHIILAGQPQLAEKLSRPCLSQLLQRIMMISRLRPLSPAESAEYIAHRLSVAGYKGRQLFSPGALAEIAERSGGVPRSINRICFNALLLGYAQEKELLDEYLIREVVSDLELSPSMAEQVKKPSICVESVPSTSTPQASSRVPQAKDQAERKRSVPIAPTSPTGTRPQPVQAQPVPSSMISGRKPAVALDTARREMSGTGTGVSQSASGRVRHNQSRGLNGTLVHLMEGTRGAFVLGASGLTLGFVLLLPTPVIESSASASQSEPLETTALQTVPGGAERTSPPPRTEQKSSDSLVTAQPLQTDPAKDMVERVHSTSNSRYLASEEHPSKAQPGLKADQAVSAPIAIEQGAKPSTPETAEMVAPTLPYTSGHGEPSGLLLRSLPVVLPGTPTVSSAAQPSATQGLAASPANFDLGHEPQLISMSQVRYPQFAKAAGIQGRVSMKVYVRENGKVEDVKVLDGNPILAWAAMNAVRNWRYKPYMVNGRPVPFHVDVSINFVNQR